MAEYGKSLTLDAQWDLTLDAGGGIATSSGDYALAQNVANACRLFTDDAFYNPERGIPHFLTDLGVRFNESVARAELQSAALSVQGVLEAKAQNLGVDIQAGQREMTGDILIRTHTGGQFNVAL